MCIGEIDCREGMLVAVDRDRYTDLPEAMATTIGLFLKEVLIPLMKRKKFKVSVGYTFMLRISCCDSLVVVWC